MLIYAIIPARSGSKGLPDKNIKEINGKPLIAYSIDFAKSLSSVSRVFCSTDSDKYAEIAKAYGAEVPFLRSDVAASDTAMEQDILIDLKDKFKACGIEEPDLVVWLRPTFVFRDRDSVEEAIKVLSLDENYTSARTVVPAESRLYTIESNTLVPTFEDYGKSMIRRQNTVDTYSVFSTDIIRFKGKHIDDCFLGDKVYPVVVSKLCGLDIDDLFDFELVKSIVEKKDGKNYESL